MRTSSIIVTLVGLAVAGGSAQVAREMLAAQQAQATIADPAAEMVEVVVARGDIRFGQAIEREQLALQKWPKGSVPEGSFLSVDEVLGTGAAEPRRAKRLISKGELLREDRVSGYGEKVTIVQSLNPDTRAMAIKVDAVSGVGGFVTPGDFVDIMLTRGRDSDLRTMTILQKVRVIGVDQVANEEVDKAVVARTVTVEVSPEQGQKLALAQRAGSLSLTLRSFDPAADEPLESVRLSDIVLDKSPLPETEAKPMVSITVRRGVATETVEFRRPAE